MSSKYMDKLPLRKTALISGWGLLFMTLFALYPYNFVLPDLIVADDPVATSNNIIAHERMFRVSLCCYLIVIVFDVLVAWSLYLFLAPVSKGVSLLTAWFRLIYGAIFAMSLGNYFRTLRLLVAPEHLTESNTNRLYTDVMFSLNAFNDGWGIGFIFFGLHLTLLGYLAFKANYIPRILGLLLILTGISYLIDYFLQFLFPEVVLPISSFLGWGELIFMFWLLFQGGRTQ